MDGKNNTEQESFDPQEQTFLFDPSCIDQKKNKDLHISQSPSIESKQETRFKKHLIQPSPNKQEYFREFMGDKKPKSLEKFTKNFLQYGIHILHEVTRPIATQLQQVFSSKNSRIIHYFVRIAYFVIKVKIFNTTEQDTYRLNFGNQISHGMFGTVYEIDNPLNRSEKVAVKVIPYSSFPIKIIENAVKQYAIMKLLAAIEVGPPLIRVFGFDIIITPNSIMFSMEKGISLESWIMENLNKETVLAQFQKLEESLRYLHFLNICHNDIKPCNIIFSPQLRKLVYIDFGFSEVKTQSPGFMVPTVAKGSLYYCSEQMKNVFLTTGEGYVDTFYNDYICLKKSKQYILKNFLYHKKGKQMAYIQKQLHCQTLQNKSTIDQIGCLCDILSIFVSFFIEEKDDKLFCHFLNYHADLLPMLQQNLRKIFEIFLEIQASLSLWHLFTKFCEVFSNQNSLIDFGAKRVIEGTLKPYFKAFLQNNFSECVNYSYNHQNLGLQEKIMKRYNKIDPYCTKNVRLEVQEEELDLTETSDEKLEIFFRRINNLHYYNQMEIVELLSTIFSRRKTWYLVSDSDIRLFQRCFSIANILVSPKNLKEGSTHQIYLGYVLLTSKLILYIQNQFNLRKILSQSLRFHYGDLIDSNRILKEFQVDEEDQNSCKEYSKFEMLQMHIFIGERMLECLFRSIPYQKGMEYIKRYMDSLSFKIIQLLQIRQQLIEVENIPNIIALVDALLRQYTNFRHQAGLRAYITSHYNNDYLNLCDIHERISCLYRQKKFERYRPIFQRIFQKSIVIKFIDQYINLTTFSLLVPPTSRRIYRVVQLLEDLNEQLEKYLKFLNSDYLSLIHANNRFKLMSICINQMRLSKAIRIANDLIDQNMILQNEQSVYIIQSLFHRLNNSKKKIWLSKKLQNFKLNELLSYEKKMVVENALFMIQTQQYPDENESYAQSHQQVVTSKQDYREKLRTIWKKCLTSKKCEHNINAKLFNLRSILSKLIKINEPMAQYIKEYEQELVKYEEHLKAFYNKAESLGIYLYNFGKDSPNFQEEISQISSQTTRDSLSSNIIVSETSMAECLLVEKHNFMLIVFYSHDQLNLQNIPYDLWNKYLDFYSEISSKYQISQQSKQNHFELVCHFNEYNYRKYVSENFSQNAKSNPEYEGKKRHLKSVMEQSIEDYLCIFNKQLLDHSFCLTILISMSQGKLQLKGFSKERIKSELKSYFYMLVQNNEIPYIFCFSSITQNFISLIIDQGVQQLFCSKEKQIPLNRSIITENAKNFWVNNEKKITTKSQQKCNQSRFDDEHFHSMDQSTFKTKQNKQVIYNLYNCGLDVSNSLLCKVFSSLSRFIKDNLCQKYCEFLVQISLQTKTKLKEKIQLLKLQTPKQWERLVKTLMIQISQEWLNVAIRQNLVEMMIPLMGVLSLKTDYKIQTSLSELKTMSKLIPSLSHQCKQFAEQYIYSQSLEYQQNRSICVGEVVCWERITHAYKKVRYFFMKLFRKFKISKLYCSKERNLDFFVSRIRERLLIPENKFRISQMLEEKVAHYLHINSDK